MTGPLLESRNDRDPVIRDLAMLAGQASRYLGPAAADDPLASPLYGDYVGIPPLLLQMGGLLHTAADGREGHARYAPCSVANLVAKGYDYWALGLP